MGDLLEQFSSLFKKDWGESLPKKVVCEELVL